MAIIPVNIENLKPDKEYLVTVRTKDGDINAVSPYTESLRFRTPTDSTIPNAPSNLQIAASFLNVLFKYDISVDNDISQYEYELYKQDQVEIVGATYRPISGETPHRTGYVGGNVFLVSIDSNSYTTSTSVITNPIRYYGRVRSIDTSGNISAWTFLAESEDTPLIDEQFIGSLSAAKITAGEIGAHTITLSGGATPSSYSMIKSSTYDFATPSQGWFIRGDGHFSLGGPNGITYDNETIVIGSDVQVEANLAADSIVVGAAPNQLIINGSINGNAGGMTLGDPTYNYWYSNGRIRVGDATKYIQWDGASLIVQGTIQAGSIGGVTIESNKIYIGTGTYANANTSFFVDNAGRFSLKDKLTWNGTSLTISGDVTIGGTSGSTIVAGAADGASALQPGEAASDVNSNTTTISGGKIRTGIIESTGFSWNGTDTYSTTGTRINLDNGAIVSKGFAVDSSGNASFKGTISSTSGEVGGWTISTSALYSGSLSASTGAAYLTASGGAWFSQGVLSPSFSGFGAPSTTGGATSSTTTSVSGGTRGYLRNISYGGTKPTSPVLGDIHFA